MTSTDAHKDQKKSGQDDSAPERSISDLEAEITLTRIEMVDTINVLTDRLHPKAIAEHASQTTKVAAQDTAALIRGDGMPADAKQARNVKILLGAAAAVVVGVGLIVLRKRRD